MDFLRLPGVLEVVIGLLGVIIFWIKADANKKNQHTANEAERKRLEIAAELEEKRFRGEAEFKERLTKMEIALHESEAKARSADVEHQESLTIATTLERLIRLQETNQQHNREERESARSEYINTLNALKETFASQHGRLAGTIAANTEAMERMATNVEQMVAENIQGRGQAVEVVKAAVGEGLKGVNTSLQAVAQDVKEVKRIVETIRPCPDDVLPKLDRIELVLMSIRQQTTPKSEIEIVPPPPDIAAPDGADTTELPKAS